MFQLQLLGEPVLLDASGEAVPVWRPAMALLSLSASAPDAGVTRERAAGLLWPELDEARARRALRQVLFRMRQDVGDILLGDRTTITVNRASVGIDVVEFGRALTAGDAMAAVDWYRGDFLTGFSLPTSPAFDHWADGRRERLRTRAGEALDALADAATAGGDWSEALRLAQRRLEIDPLSECAGARVIALHHQRGDGGRALALYELLRERFITQLGAPPTGDLEAIARRIRQSPAGSAPAFRVPAVSGDARAADGAFQLPLVGRAAEFEQLMERWDVACGGARQVVVIGGEEGVGKTRLADEFRRWVGTRGATTLWSRAYEIERRIPYASLVGALREALHAPGLAGVDERTPRELGAIVPGFAARFAGTDAAPMSAGIQAGRLRVLDAVRDVLDNLAYEAPVLLVLDDVQWSDEASLAVLNYVCRTLPQSPILLLLTARAAELAPTDAATRLLHGLSREPGGSLHRINLAPLDEAAIHAVLVGLGHAETDVQGVARALLLETGGNALFLTELLHADGTGQWRARLADRAPASGTAGVERDADARERLSVLAADRLLRLTDAPRRLLEAAAVLGRQFPLRLAAILASLDPTEAAGAMDVLLRRGLLRQVEYGYDFGHGVLRREVLHTIGAARLAELHAAAYAELEPAAATELDTGVERANALAHHAARGGLNAAAHRWYLHAADRAIRLYAGAEAEAALLSALDHALDTTTRRATRIELAQLAWVRSDYAGAARSYRQALRLCDDPAERLTLRIRMLDAGLRGGILGPADADELAPLLLDEAAGAGPAPLRDVCIALAEAYAPGRRSEALTYAERAVAAARKAADPQPLVTALLLLSRLAAGPAVTQRPLTWLREALNVARAHQLERERIDAQIELGTELSRIGRWDDAVAALRSALTDAARSGETGAEIVAAINLSDLLIRRGEWVEAETLLDDGDRIAARHDFPHADAAIRLNRALFTWLRGDGTATAASTARDAADRAASAGVRAAERAARALLVLNHLEAGDVSRARAEAERMNAVARARHANWAADEELAIVATARLTRAAGGAEDIAGLEAAVGGAVSACGAALLRLELAHARASGPGDSVETRDLHAAALATLERLGAGPLIRRLDQPLSGPIRSSAPADGPALPA